MDNLNTYASSNPIPNDISSTTNNGSFLDGFKNISFFTWFIIILIFSFFGFNIFVYLAQGTQDITDLLGPLIKKTLGVLGLVTKEVVDITAEGTRAIFDGTAKVVDKATTAIQNAVDKPFEEAIAKKKAEAQGQATSNTASSSAKPSQIQQPPNDIMQANALNKALNTAAAASTTNSQEYEADDSTSSIQQGGAKSGWCYIGEDRGFRTCAEVGVNDDCMSGDIFPSHEICINPNLRP
jgi:hypothetical protein